MHYSFPNVRLIVFTKAPLAGQCKSRLAATIGSQAAAALQAELIERCIKQVCEMPLCPVELWCAPDTEHPLFQSLAEAYSLELYTQQGEDLGQRMFHAMSHKQADMTLIIGTDCPEMSADYIHIAMTVLAGGKDAVIGPAEDGGYVLLGLRHIESGLFSDIKWGTGQVYAQTLRALELLGYRWQVLRGLWDIDVEADWQRYKSLKSATYE